MAIKYSFAFHISDTPNGHKYSYSIHPVTALVIVTTEWFLLFYWFSLVFQGISLRLFRFVLVAVAVHLVIYICLFLSLDDVIIFYLLIYFFFSFFYAISFYMFISILQSRRYVLAKFTMIWFLFSFCFSCFVFLVFFFLFVLYCSCHGLVRAVTFFL